MFLTEFGKFVIRVSGMFLFVYGFIRLPDYIMKFLSLPNVTGPFGFVGTVIFPFGIVLIIGSILMWFPTGFLKRILRMGEQEIVEPDFQWELNARAVIIGLALYLLVTGISDTAYHLSNLMLILSSVVGEFPLSAYNYPVFIGSLVQVLAALAILFNSKLIARRFG